MDTLYNNITQQYNAVQHGLPPVPDTLHIFQDILQFIHFVNNKRNITHEKYFRIQSEFVR